MNHINRNVMLTDQLERKLIQQEINRQMAFAPLFDGKGFMAKIASLFGSARVEGSLRSTSAAH